MIALSADPLIEVHDDLLPEGLQHEVQTYLVNAPWQFGSVSSTMSKSYPYWYRHFGGFSAGNSDDCAEEVRATAPVIANVWDHVSEHVVPGHKLVRCYANGYPYGTEGTTHRDSNNPTDLTVMLYANHAWDVGWAGETMFFTMRPPLDVVAAVMPKPNRMVVFSGCVPHVARAISRLCPMLRITLMFKTQKVT